MLFNAYIFLCIVWDCVEVEMRLAEPNEFPWAASIQNESRVHLCGGSVLNTLYVLTGCSCLGEQSSVVVMAGSNNLKPAENESWTGQVRNSVEVIRHKKCKEAKQSGHVRPSHYGWKNNFALIKIDSPFTLEENLKPMTPSFSVLEIATQSNHTEHMLGHKCFVISWGYMVTGVAPNIEPSNSLMVSDVKVIDGETCKKLLCEFYTYMLHNCDPSRFDNEIRKEFCGVQPFEEKNYFGTKMQVLVGDVGGSVSCLGQVHGLTSWRGTKAYYPWFDSKHFSANPYFPTMFASIESAWPWMATLIEDLPTVGTTPAPTSPTSATTPELESTTPSPPSTPSSAVSLAVQSFIQSIVVVSSLKENYL